MKRDQSSSILPTSNLFRSDGISGPERLPAAVVFAGSTLSKFVSQCTVRVLMLWKVNSVSFQFDGTLRLHNE